MLTVATSLTACRKTPSSSGQQLRHELGALGRGRDRVAEEVAAAGEERADGRGVGALDHQRAAPRRAAAITLVGDGAGPPRAAGRLRGPKSRCRRPDRAAPHSGPGMRPYGSGQASMQRPQAGAVLEVELDGHEARARGRSRCPASMQCWAQALDAAPAALAVLRQDERLGLFRSRRHAWIPFLGSKACKHLASPAVPSISGIAGMTGPARRKYCASGGNRRKTCTINDLPAGWSDQTRPARSAGRSDRSVGSCPLFWKAPGKDGPATPSPQAVRTSSSSTPACATARRSLATST